MCGRIDQTRALRNADAVFRGRVTARRPPAGRDEQRIDLRFEVDAVYKGTVYHDQVVGAPKDSAGCGLNPEVGTTWIVFAVDGVEGDGDDAVSRLVTTLCSGNLPTRSAPAVLGQSRAPGVDGASDREEKSTQVDRRLTRGLAIGGLRTAVRGRGGRDGPRRALATGPTPGQRATAGGSDGGAADGHDRPRRAWGPEGNRPPRRVPTAADDPALTKSADVIFTGEIVHNQTAKLGREREYTFRVAKVFKGAAVLRATGGHRQPQQRSVGHRGPGKLPGAGQLPDSGETEGPVTRLISNGCSGTRLVTEAAAVPQLTRTGSGTGPRIVAQHHVAVHQQAADRRRRRVHRGRDRDQPPVGSTP